MRAPTISREMLGQGFGWETWMEHLDIRDFGAREGGLIDCSNAFQIAVDTALSRGGKGNAVFIPPGDWLCSKEIVVNNHNATTEGFTLFGAAGHVSRIICPTSGFVGDAVFDVNCEGKGCQFQDFVLTAAIGGNFDVYAIKATGDGMVFETLWLAGLKAGLYFWEDTHCGGIRVSNCQSELNHTNYKCDKARSIVFINCHSFQATNLGFAFTGQISLSGEETLSHNAIIGGSIIEDNLIGIYDNSNVPLIIDSVDINSYNNERPEHGIKIESGASRVIVANSGITHAKIAGIYNGSTTTNLIVNSCQIERIGYYDQSTPWYCYGIYSKGKLQVSNCEIVDCAGYGIHSTAYNTQISNTLLTNCAQGGSDLGGVNPLIGDKAFYWDPPTTTSILLFSNNAFEAVYGSGAGKTAIHINNTAVPAAGNIKIHGNDVASGHFANMFVTTLSDTQMACQDIFANYPAIPDFIATLANDATPSVANIKKAKTGGTTTITALDDGQSGQDFMLIGDHTTTQLTDGGTLKLEGNCVLDVGDTIYLIFDGTNWHEISRTNVTP